MKVDVENITVSIANQQILQDLNLVVEDGEFIGLLGPNGSGKSTLLRSIYRVLKPDAGLISLNGHDVYCMSQRETARQMAVMRQEHNIHFEFSVWEMVLMGRTPHKQTFDRDNDRDDQIVREALFRVGMETFAHRSFQTLSGGEKQRVLLARALAQEAKILLLDEPTNHLDIRCQLQIMELVNRLDVTAVSALHDLNLAASYCDRLYLMNDGCIAGSGFPEEVLVPELIQQVFGVKTTIISHPVTGRPHIIFFTEDQTQTVNRQGQTM